MPYNPGVNSDAGTQAIIAANAQGAQFTQMFVNQWMKAGEQAKADKAEYKALQAMVDVYAPKGPAGDAMRDAAAVGGLPALKGAMKGFMQLQADEASKTKMDRDRAELAQYGAETEANTALASFARDEATGDPGPRRAVLGSSLPGYTGGDSAFLSQLREMEAAQQPDARRRYAQERNPGAVNARGYGDLMRYGAEGGAGGAEAFFKPGQISEEVPGLPGGRRVVLGPNQSQFVNAPENLIETKPDYEPDPGMMHSRNGKYWVQKKDPTQWETIVEGGQYGQPRYTRERFVGKGGAGGGGAGAAAGGEASPNVTEAEYAKLNKGDPYWWNGKQLFKK